MIRINLLGEKVDKTAFYALQIFIVVLCLALSFGAFSTATAQLNAELTRVQHDQRSLQLRLTKLKRKLSAKMNSLKN